MHNIIITAYFFHATKIITEYDINSIYGGFMVENFVAARTILICGTHIIFSTHLPLKSVALDTENRSSYLCFPIEKMKPASFDIFQPPTNQIFVCGILVPKKSRRRRP